MILNLLMCKCEEEGCGHKFVSTSTDYLDCPVCGSENIEGTWKKAAIFEDIDYHAIEGNEHLIKKLAYGVNDIEDAINANIQMKTALIDWFCVNKYEQPEEVVLEFEFNFDNSEEGEERFTGITFEGSENVNYDKLEELYDEFSYTFSMHELTENRKIKLK